MRTKRGQFLLLAFLALSACGPRSNPERLVPDDTAIIRDWQCESAIPEQPGQFQSNAPTKGRLAARLLQCPFNTDLQAEALAHKSSSDITSEELTELVTKIRWGLDYEYRLYEETVRHTVKPARIIPRFIFKILPGSRFLNALVPDITDNHIVVGPARDLLIMQMRADRRATADAIDAKLATSKKRPGAYPLWLAMIDLDAYATAGSIDSAIESLEVTLSSRSRAYSQ